MRAPHARRVPGIDRAQHGAVRRVFFSDSAKILTSTPVHASTRHGEIEGGP